MTVCTTCAYSSNKILANDSMSCVASSQNCNIANCTTCTMFQGAERCQMCDATFLANPSFTCSAVVAGCSSANAHECSSSKCATYSWMNGTCSVAYTCTNDLQVWSSGSCVSCSGLNSSSCNTTCVDWYFNTNNSTCESCVSKYGANCIQCSMTVCTACAFSSNTILAADSLSCGNTSTNCNSANCASCSMSAGN